MASQNPSLQSPTKRIWEIDFLRSWAVLGMIYFHVFYMLDFWDIKNTILFEGGWEFFGNTIRNIFFFLVGVGMVLSYQRHQALKKPPQEYYARQLTKGGILLFLGLVLTAISFVVLPEKPIRFGVLSFLGSSMILLLPFIHRPRLLVGVVFLVMGVNYVFYDFWSHDSFAGYIVGFYPRYWPSIDYFPIIPWLASVAIGAFLGHVFFQAGQRKYTFVQESPRFFRPFNWIGRKALWIYLFHMPVIVFFFWILQKIGQNNEVIVF